MYPQRSYRSILNDFLSRINENRIRIPPYNNDAQIVAAQARNGGRIQRLTGKCLLKQNIQREANRLHIHRQRIINLATVRIWNIHFGTYQRNQFSTLANDANHINQRRLTHIRMTNQEDTLHRISQMTLSQLHEGWLRVNLTGDVQDDDGLKASG
ncbi:7916_t:CDS:2 [Funneliformis geosporum]|uniref:12229_t:CDS:1 n=1 Tax=Funneliformis geosporum TaxID=1117311 RepID=A0A9W4SKB4_9GLOM|nr:12229_t:CDS:2 [Funneliformis geosporum]CAI2180624.1 7916_t:CDS:2 [Funneliformis geosporum]